MSSSLAADVMASDRGISVFLVPSVQTEYSKRDRDGMQSPCPQCVPSDEFFKLLCVFFFSVVLEH